MFFTTVTDAGPKSITSKGLTLVCLHKGFGDPILVNYVCIVKKGRRVATNQILLKGTDPLEVPNIESKEVIALLPNRFKKQAEKAFLTTYTKISPKLGEELFDTILKVAVNEAHLINSPHTRYRLIKV